MQSEPQKISRSHISLGRLLKLIQKQLQLDTIPWITRDSIRKKDPYRVLFSCIVSLRTKDAVTALASKRLFKKASNPKQLLALSTNTLERLIYPAGFYRVKARTMRAVAQELIKRYNGRVPCTRNELLSLKGVGRKTANLVLGLGFGIPAICVDTHVHRISNRLGWVHTRTPDETEHALMDIMPRKWWIKLNTLIVSFGQTICTPVSPWCSKCHINRYCKKRGVGRSR